MNDLLSVCGLNLMTPKALPTSSILPSILGLSRLISLLSFGSKPCMPVSCEFGHFDGRGGVQHLHRDWLHLSENVGLNLCVLSSSNVPSSCFFLFLKIEGRGLVTQLNDREIWAYTGQSKGTVRVILSVLPSVSQTQQIFLRFISMREQLCVCFAFIYLFII